MVKEPFPDVDAQTVDGRVVEREDCDAVMFCQM
jgi:hypothetical protein